MQITDNDIQYTEQILLPHGIKFDDQRRNFIKNLETIDLQAVPGSGKTTTLLAKLLILEKHLPFSNGSGILVISHTNTAVDEITSRIASYCPRLFSYPSFVGTIQGFVDHFLAMPFYINTYRRKPYRIDDEIYEEKVFVPYKAQGWLNNNANIREKVLYKSRLDDNDELVFGFNNPGEFPLKTKTSDTYKAIFEMKKKLLEDGVLCFDDAYFLALKATKQYPIFRTLLQKRFHYVFVDEMQDMDKHQYDLLEEIFYASGTSASVFQRIGDKNQAIFSGFVKLENFWKSNSRKVLNIDGSCRFSKEIADVVKCFALEPQNIEGKAIHKSIKPHLLIYTDDTIRNVLPKFIDIIKDKITTNEINIDLIGRIKAIGWRKNVNDVNKVAIKNYFPQFNEEMYTNKIDYSNLDSYFYDVKQDTSEKRSLAESRKNILNAFLRVLRYENIIGHDGRYYSKRRLVNFLEDENLDLYKELKLKLYLWSKGIYHGKTDNVLREIKQYFPVLLQGAFSIDKMLDKTQKFINDDLTTTTTEITDNSVKNRVNNIYRKDGFDVEIGTIHSIKGETHVATLYMETYYDKGYESERLKKCFMGQSHSFSNSTRKDTRKKESIKMAYVGMSRPTHLLCVAVHENRVKNYLHKIPDSKWEKVEVK